MSLKDYGWTPFFAASLEPFAQQSLEAGRIVLAHGAGCRLRTAAGEVAATVTGRLRHLADSEPEQLPVIGDWVALHAPETNGTTTIRAVLPRRSKLSRKVAGARTREQVMAANVDTVFLVMGLDGDFNLRRLERLLTMTWDSGAQPVVVLNKADLCGEPEERRREVETVALGVPVILMSVLHDPGLEAIAPFLKPGETVALVGSSGVGKSTLINRLCGRRVMRTRKVRNRDDRGQHTTTHRQLVRLPSGGLLIDNPGIRELQLWSSEEGLGDAFQDVEALAPRCRYHDCRHQGEPGCAVQAAVDDGTLAAERLASRHALERELRYLELRQDEWARRSEKKKTAAIHKAAKRHKPRRI